MSSECILVLRHDHDALYHHGIKGQKWGVRRFQDKSGRLTKAGKERYSDADSDKNQESNEYSNKKRGLTDKQKKYIKIGAIACGTYKLIDSGKMHAFIEDGKAALKGEKYGLQINTKR